MQWKKTLLNMQDSLYAAIKEIKTRLEMVSSGMTRLISMWKSNMTFSVKIKLFKSLWFSFFYKCVWESRTLTIETNCRIQALEYICFRKTAHMVQWVQSKFLCLRSGKFICKSLKTTFVNSKIESKQKRMAETIINW